MDKLSFRKFAKNQDVIRAGQDAYNDALIKAKSIGLGDDEAEVAAKDAALAARIAKAIELNQTGDQ